jgi:hypothetical protein
LNIRYFSAPANTSILAKETKDGDKIETNNIILGKQGVFVGFRLNNAKFQENFFIKNRGFLIH